MVGSALPAGPDGMDDIFRRKAISSGNFCITGSAAADRTTFGQELRPCSAVNSAVDPSPAEQ